MFEDAGGPKIEAPPGAKPMPGEARIFAMPEKFRGLAAKINPPAIKPAAVSVVPPKPLPPPLPPKPTLHKRGLAKTTKAIIIAGAVLLLVLGSAGAYVYFSLKPVNQPANTTANNTVKANNSANSANAGNKANTANTSANTGTVSPFPNNSQPGRDTDSDGLTDAEELLYRTSSKKPDTDSDGFLDGNEVFHGYDPNASAPAKLSASDIVTLFEVADSYSLNFPTAWVAKPDKKTNGAVFVVPSGETIALSWEEKTSETDLARWFSGVNPNTDIKVSAGATKQGYAFLLSEDQMTYYIDMGRKVAVLNYQNTVKASVDYLATFEMMMNSLKYAEGGVE